MLFYTVKKLPVPEVVFFKDFITKDVQHLTGCGSYIVHIQ